MGTPLGPKYIPYTYMDPLGNPTNTKPPTSCAREVLTLAAKDAPRADFAADEGSAVVFCFWGLLHCRILGLGFRVYCRVLGLGFWV